MAAEQYLSLPGIANGLAPASANVAWNFGAWVLASAALPTEINIIGIAFQITDASPGADALRQELFEIGTGAEGAEVTKIQIPWSILSDTTAYGYYSRTYLKVFLSEPYVIAQGTRVAVRATDSIASIITYGGVKILYKEIAVPVNIALNTALLTATGKTITVVKGAIIKILDTAITTATGQILTVVNLPIPTNILLNTAILTATGQNGTVVKGAVTTLLDTAVITTTGQTLSVVKGAVTIALDVATITATGQITTIDAGIAPTIIPLDTSVIIATGQSANILKGAVTIPLDTSLVTAVGQLATLVKGAVILPLDTAIINATGQTIAVDAGGVVPVTIPLDTATIIAIGQSASILKGMVTIPLDTANIIVAGQTITVNAGGPIIIALTTALILSTGIAISVVSPPVGEIDYKDFVPSFVQTFN